MFLPAFKKSPGKATTAMLALLVVVVLIVIATYALLRWNASRKPQGPVDTEPPKPVYEKTIGDVKFTFESAFDMGKTMSVSKQGINQTLTTTEKFLKVTIGAQNKGILNVNRYLWEVGNIIDSEGRNFVSIDEQAYYFLPNPNQCGALLKPEFKPTPCIKFYEVSRASEGLKIVVSIIDPASNKKHQEVLDVAITK